MTPRILPVGRNIGHLRSRYSESEKNSKERQSGDAPIFAYLRRSTDEKKQPGSMTKQTDSIDLMLADNGLLYKDLTGTFADEATAFNKVQTKNGAVIKRMRPGFTALLEAIKKVKVPCILFVFDVSRLSRNSPDGILILELLGKLGQKEKIAEIRFYNKDIWTKDTSEHTIMTAINDASGYSQKISENRILKNGQALRRGIMPKTIRPSRGLKYTSYGIEETDEIPFICKAFEMKADRKPNKEILRYLKKQGFIISEKHLAKIIFQNTLYYGTYTNRSTGEVWGNRVFIKGKPPITFTLFEKVQSVLNKKSAYGDKQGENTLKELFNTGAGEWRKGATVDKKKEKHINYKVWVQTVSKYASISEKKVLETCIKEVIPKIFDVYFEIYYEINRKQFFSYGSKLISPFDWSGFDKVIDSLSAKDKRKFFDLNIEIDRVQSFQTLYLEGIDISYNSTEEEIEEALKSTHWIETSKEATKQRKKQFFLRERHQEFQDLQKREFDIGRQINELVPNKYHSNYDNTEEIDLITESITQSTEAMREFFKQSNFYQQSHDLKEDRDSAIKVLEGQKEKIESEIKNAKKNYSNSFLLSKDGKGEIDKESFDEFVGEKKKEIKYFDEQIQELLKPMELEQYLEKLPEVLSKTFELARNIDGKSNNEVIRDDIVRLMKLATFELTLNNKKELKIKLFDALDDLIYPNGGTSGVNIRTFVENYYRVEESYATPKV